MRSFSVEVKGKQEVTKVAFGNNQRSKIVKCLKNKIIVAEFNMANARRSFKNRPY